MTYRELKDKQQKEVNEFPFGFAFSDKQFEEMMKKFGLKKDDYKEIYSIGAGGFVKKSDAQKMDEMFNRHRKEMQEEIENDKKGTKFIYEMFKYELANHEYGYTFSLDDTLNSLGLTRKQIENNKNLKNGLEKALKEYKRKN